MKLQLFLCFCLLIIVSSCSPKLTKVIETVKEGEGVIQYQNGDFSEVMSVKDAFAALKSNEKLYLGEGRAELFEPLSVENLQNIQIIGRNTQLVAKLDMPVITFRDIDKAGLQNLLVVHEIGEWCAQNCVEFYRATNLDIRNCKFDGSGYFGLALTNVKNANIEGNKFYNCEYGFAAWGSENLNLKNNEFSNNRGEDVQSNGDDQFSNDVRKDNVFVKD